MSGSGSTPIDGDAAPTRRPLSGAVLLVGPGWECTLPVGEYLIGRDSTCRVFVDDGLASREHARLHVRSAGTTVVDEASANGVFVNNLQITEPHILFHGDRLLIGSTEIGVFNGNLAEVHGAEDDARPTLMEMPETLPMPAATVRAAAVEVLGRVADRMLAAGDAEKAKQILADQLVKILNGARSGLPIPRELCWTASRYALKLASALGEGVWIDFTMEIHLRGEQPMPPETLDDLMAALPHVSHIDRAMFTHYAKWLAQVAPKLGGHASEIARRLQSVALP